MLLAYFIVSGLALTLSLFVFSRNTRERLHQYYLLFTIFVVLWMSGAVLQDTPETLFDAHYRLLFVFSPIMSILLLLFISELAQKKWSLLFKALLGLGAVAVSYLSLFTNLITEHIFIDRTGSIVIDDGPLYMLVTVGISVVGALSIPVLALALRRGVSDKQRKQQIKVVLITLLISVTIAVATSFLLPHFTEDFRYYRLTPLASLVFTLGFAYAILKLKMFNLKAVAARGFAYMLAILGLVFTYSLFANVLAPIFSGGEIRLSGAEYVSSILTTVILVLFYPSIKRWFDKFTNHIFFRDAYDPQVFLDRLNKILVKSIDIEILLRNSCSLIEESVKAEHVSFFVRDTSYYSNRLVGNYTYMISESDAQELEAILPKTRKKVIYVDQFDKDVDHYESHAKDILRRNNIEVLVRIVSTLEYEVSGIGYLLLGQKLSGNMYDKQDLRVLEIVGNELEIAVENALRFEEMQQFNITLQDKIEGATKELKKSNAKLRELDEAKDEFISMASHQLRTPLTAVKGYISMLLDGDAGKATPEQKKMLSQAMLSSQRMVHLISDLLNVSRMKTKKFTINQKSTYLPDVVVSEVSQLKDGATGKKVKLHFEKPKRFPMLNIDEVKLRQVIMNFTDNAIYYTPEGGKVNIELKNRRDSVEFLVHDSGIGVPKDEQHRLFHKFYRAGNARKVRPDGTGLGLYMAKKVVAAQGGEIIFKSTEGKGSTFGFRLPKSKLEITAQ